MMAIDLAAIRERVYAANLSGEWEEEAAADREALLNEVVQLLYDVSILEAERDFRRDQVNRVRALADKWEHGALRWADPLPVPPVVEQLRAALGGVS